MVPDSALKRCRECQRLLPFGDFYERGTGHMGVCKECARSRSKAYYASHREQSRLYYMAHREQVMARSNAYYAQNRERILSRAKGDKAFVERARANHKRWRDAHSEKMRAKNKAHRVRQRQQVRQTTYELVDPVEVFEKAKWRCRLCGCKIPRDLRGGIEPNAPTIDHIVPLSLGGPHTRANLQCLCRRCNMAKSDMYQGQLRFA